MKFLLLPLILTPFFSMAGDIVENARIIEVRNTAANEDIFEIIVQGGVGPCANKIIQFPLASAKSKSVHDRAFSMALTAFNTGSKVRVHNYKSNDCKAAVYITLRH